MSHRSPQQRHHRGSEHAVRHRPPSPERAVPHTRTVPDRHVHTARGRAAVRRSVGHPYPRRVELRSEERAVAIRIRHDGRPLDRKAVHDPPRPERPSELLRATTAEPPHGCTREHLRRARNHPRLSGATNGTSVHITDRGTLTRDHSDCISVVVTVQRPHSRGWWTCDGGRRAARGDLASIGALPGRCRAQRPGRCTRAHGHSEASQAATASASGTSSSA
jgi:hypothetical protein